MLGKSYKKIIVLSLVAAFCVVGWFGLTNFVHAQQLDLGINQVSSSLGLPTADIRLVVARIIRAALGLLGILAVGLMLYAGFVWMTSAGNEEKIGEAKKIMINAAIGLAIILSAYSIVSFVINGLVGATTNIPPHCSDGIWNEGETGLDCGGTCPACPAGPDCYGASCLAGFKAQLPVGGQLCVRNYHPAVLFNRPVNLNTLQENLVLNRKDNNERIPGVWVVGPTPNSAIFNFNNGDCNFAPGKVGETYQSESVKSFTAVSSASLNSLQANSFSYAFWVKVNEWGDKVNASETVFYKLAGGYPGEGVSVSLNKSSRNLTFTARCQVADLSVCRNITATSPKVDRDRCTCNVGLSTPANNYFTEGQWQFVVLVADKKGLNTNIKIYINGSLVSEVVTDKVISAASGRSLILGQQNSIYALDDFRAFSKVLTQTDVSYLYNNPGVNTPDSNFVAWYSFDKADLIENNTKFTDKSGNNNHIVWDGNKDSNTDCLLPQTTYALQVLNNGTNIQSVQDQVLSCDMSCASKMGCCKTVEFTTGVGVDRTPPTINLSFLDPYSGFNYPIGKKVTAYADFRDDSGVQNVDLYLNNFYFNGQNFASCQRSGRAFFDIDTTGFNPGVQNIKALATDLTGLFASSTRTFTLLPGHCFDGIKNDGEVGVDCGGGGCLDCTGNRCAANEQCSTGYCEPTTGTCVEKAMITSVTPSSGAPGTYVSIIGKYFGEEPGKVYFSSSQQTNNLLQNPSFEDWNINSSTPLAWSFGKNGVATGWSGNSTAKDGVRAVRLVRGSAGVVADSDYIYFNQFVNPDYLTKSSFTGSVYARSGIYGDKGGKLFLFIRTLAASGKYYFWNFNNNNWEEFDGVMLAPTPSDSNHFKFFGVSTDYAQYLQTVTAAKDAGLEYIWGFKPTTTSSDILVDNIELKPLNYQAINWLEAKLVSCGRSFDSWRNNQILALVPNGAGNGPVKIETTVITDANRNRWQFSDTTNDDWGPRILDFEVNNLVRPGICGVAPAAGAPGASVTISGDNLPVNSASGQVKFGLLNARADSWADSEIRAIVPSLESGVVGLKVLKNDIESNSIQFNITGIDENTTGPVILGISPDRGARGEYITIAGKNFGNGADGIGQVWFKLNGVGNALMGEFNFPPQCTRSDYWQDNQIIVKAPSALDTLLGNYTVQVRTKSGDVSALGTNFKIELGAPAPGICKLDPDNGPVTAAGFRGKTIKIFGDYFTVSSLLISANPEVIGNYITNVYFWKNGASSTAINGRILATATVNNTNEITATIPAGTETGPVAAYRSVDKKMSNGLNFKVQNCVEAGNVCSDSINKRCCVVGADAGICRPKTERCEGEILSAGYIWRFSTRDIPETPHVVEWCDTKLAGASLRLPTPSPSAKWGSDTDNMACRQALGIIEFTTPLTQSSINGSSVVVRECDGAFKNECVNPGATVTLTPASYNLLAAQASAGGIGQYVSLQPNNIYNNGLWRDNTWYQIVLKKTIYSGTGNSIAYLSTDNPCADVADSAYCFVFKTGAKNCKLSGVIITPYAFWTSYLESPMKQHIIGSVYDLDYRVQGLSEQKCIAMNASAYNWSWGSPSVGYVDLYSVSPDNLSAKFSSLQNTVGVLSGDVAIIRARAFDPISGSNYYGNSPLTIDLSKPKVLSHWPDCLEACTNAEIGVEFNITMSEKNLSELTEAGPVRLYRCLDENCSSVVLENISRIETYPSNNNSKLRIVPSSVLATNTLYKVELSGTSATPIPRTAGVMTNFLWSAAQYNNPASFSKPFNELYEWRFRTKKEACTVSRVEVLPPVFVARSLNSKAIYTATPYSAGDTCDPNGQRLDAWGYNWDWISSNLGVATVSKFTTKGYNSFCTNKCVRKGADVPAVAGNSNLRVCGNEKVEAGEDCDPVGGPSVASRCGLDCLFLGNSSTTPNISVSDIGLCGDGFVSSTRGEECDPRSPTTSLSLGCTNNCLHTGSKTKTESTNINDSICGSSEIGAGEDCELGITASSTNPLSAAGCSPQCLHRGTRLSTKWCADNRPTFGGFDQTAYNTACALAYSQCGDGVPNPDEDPECDTLSGVNALCDERCLLKVQPPCDTPNTPGCSADGKLLGSSLLYNNPSVCGDGVVGTGESDFCDTVSNFTVKHNLVDPWALVSGVFLSSGGTEKVNEHFSDINAITTGKMGTGKFIIPCGYETDNQCATSFDATTGVGYDSCCYNKPHLTSVYPGSTSTVKNNICPNTEIQVEFDKPMDKNTLSGNFVIARGIMNGDCGANEEVTNLIVRAEIKDNKWYVRLFGWLRQLFVNNAAAVSPVKWCAGQDLGTAELTDISTTVSRLNVRLSAPLATSTDYAIILKSGLRDKSGVSIGDDGSGKAIKWKFVTGDKICEIDKVNVRPANVFFSTAGANTVLTAEAKTNNGAIIQSIPNFYAWNFVWAPQDNVVVNVPSTTINTNLITAQNRNGEIDVRAAASMTANIYTTEDGLVATGKSHIIVFLCENPWPPAAGGIFPYEDKTGNNDGFNLNINIFDGTRIQQAPAGSGYFNFSTYYCADNGGIGVYDDLPYLRPVIQTTVGNGKCSVTQNSCGNSGDCMDWYKIDNDYYQVRYKGNVYGRKICVKTDVPVTSLNNIAGGLSDYLNCNDDTACQTKFGGSVYSCVPVEDLDTGVYHNHTVSTVSQSCSNMGDGLKRFLLTNNKNADALGIQIFSNPTQLTINEWYQNSQAFGGQGFGGQTQAVKINGYDAITDGDNIYVDALNWDNNNLYSNIYLFSINADAKPETRKVLEQIMGNLKFNINLTNYGYCGANVDNPEQTVKCQSDFDCPTGQICSVQIDKLKRNYKRLRDWGEIVVGLNQATLRNDGQFPELKEGTYLAGQTISTWPSWSNLGTAAGFALPADPINRLGVAGSCSSAPFDRFCLADSNCTGAGGKCILHDALTGWSTADRRFSYACNTSSLAYRYVFSSTTGYTFYGRLEDSGVSVNWNNFINNLLKDSADKFKIGGYNDNNSICLSTEEISTVQGGRCGDGKLNPGEACDGPGKVEYIGQCGISQAQIQLHTCNANCQWGAPQAVNCSTLSKCGNGIMEAGEVCDDGALNGKYNHCRIGCQFTTSTAGWCGDGEVLPAYEICDPGSKQIKYDLEKNNSCNFDCQSYGPYCGDGIVQSNFGEECDGNVTGCTTSTLSGTQFCSASCKKVQPLPDNGWFCSTTVEQVVATETKCGNGIVEASEACDQGSAKNGVACTAGYNKPCTYCAVDCQNTINIAATGYCGDGKVNGTESCDADPISGTIYASASSAGTYSTLTSNGYQVKTCSIEKNTLLNVSSSVWSSSSLLTFKKGTKSCINNCTKLQVDCVECGSGLNSPEKGSIISGGIINVLSPASTNPLYVTGSKQGTMNLVFTASTYSALYKVAYHSFTSASNANNYTLHPSPENTTNSSKTAYVNFNPICSASSAVTDQHYQLVLNADNSYPAHWIDVPVVSQPIPSQYDLLLSPVITSTRKQDLRIVVSWVGDDQFFSGFVDTASGNVRETFAIAPGSNYYTIPNLYHLGVWSHGFGATKNKSNVRSYTVELSSGSMPTTFPFYVRALDPVENYRNSSVKLKVEVYFPEIINMDARTFSRPSQTYYFGLNTLPSANDFGATLWHVFNLKKLVAPFTRAGVQSVEVIDRVITEGFIRASY